jgi:hypothetical protein
MRITYFLAWLEITVFAERHEKRPSTQSPD